MADGAEMYEVTAHGQQCVASFIALSAGPFEDANSCWVHIAREGEWLGHSKGEFAFSDEVFAKILSNANARETPLSFDYEHDSLNPNLSGPKISSGVIKKLELRDDGLYAFVAWTPRAAEMIRSGEYRHCSAVVHPNSKHRQTGERIGPELLGVALTNDPFIDGLHPIQLTRAQAMSAAAVTAAVADEPIALTVVPADPPAATPVTAPAATPVATPEPVKVDGNPDILAFLSSVADKAGASMDASLAILMDKLDAVVALVTSNTGDGTLADARPMSAGVARGEALALVELRVQRKQMEALEAQVLQLTAANAAASQEVKKQTVESKVKALVETGFVPDGEADIADAVFLFTADPERAARVYSKQIVPIGNTDAGKDPLALVTSIETVTTAGLSVAEEATVIMLSRTYSKEDALKFIGLTRGNRMSAADAAQKISADNAAKKG